MLSVLTQFQSNRSQHVIADDCRTKPANVVSGVPHGSILGPLLFRQYTSELFSFLENKLTGNADECTLMTVNCAIPRRYRYHSRVPDTCLGRVNECCDLRGTKLNASKTKATIVSR